MADRQTDTSEAPAREAPGRSGRRMELVRCFQCRRELGVEAGCVEPAPCGSPAGGALLHLREERLPEWVRARVEREGWTRGKLHCPGCGGKLGSFDFVSGRKCACGEHVMPAVHLVRSQVDAAPAPPAPPAPTQL